MKFKLSQVHLIPTEKALKKNLKVNTPANTFRILSSLLSRDMPRLSLGYTKVGVRFNALIAKLLGALDKTGVGFCVCF